MAVSIAAALHRTTGLAEDFTEQSVGSTNVLVYPCYAVRDGCGTSTSSSDTNSEYEVVKVRFLEGYNSREVLDFNLYLQRRHWLNLRVYGGA